MFFGIGPADSSFVFSITGGTPSPRKQDVGDVSFAKKYKPRDSGIIVSDEEDMFMGGGRGSISGDFLSVMPQASTSVGSIFSDADEGLVTPGAGPSPGSGWPESAMIYDELRDKSMNSSFGGSEGGVDMDAFILRTLAAGAKVPQEGGKKIPGTPVEKVKTSHLTVDRPWQSAVANKVGLGFGFDLVKGIGKAPRKSLPAAFPTKGTGRKNKTKLELNLSDSEGEEEISPTSRKEKQGYGMLGLGRLPAGDDRRTY